MMDAVARGMELLETKGKDLPPLALEAARHLCRQVGGCLEVILTAYANYAEIIEGLPCNDGNYACPPDMKKFLLERKEAHADTRRD